MSDAESATILRFVLQDLKSQQQQQQQPLGSTRLNVSDMHGQVLSALPAADLTLLQSASQLVHRGAVKRVTAQPSGRSFFRVESLNRYQPRNSNGDNDDAADASHVSHLDTSASQPFDGSLVRGRGPNYYNVLPHYCSCQGFHEHTVVQSPVAMCKHILAALLADATGQCQSLSIQDLDFAKMLCAQIEPPSSEHSASHSEHYNQRQQQHGGYF